jgi:hypothetical protein
MVLSSLVAVKTLLNAGSEMMPDITPSGIVSVSTDQSISLRYLRSYPNNKNPMVAMVDTVQDSFRPDIPAKVGGAMVTNR